MRLPLLVLHIAGGIVGLLSGTVAMVYRKGSPGHRTAGKIFVISMLIMAACATYLAVLKHQMGNIIGGPLTFYMITTAWLAGRRGDQKPGAFDRGALALALAIGISLWTLGILMVLGQVEPQQGIPLEMCFVMGTIPLLAAGGDIRMFVRGGISGRDRVVRHLWRMCFGLFIATGSFFLGQQQVFPGSDPQTIHPRATCDPSSAFVDLLVGACEIHKTRKPSARINVWKEYSG